MRLTILLFPTLLLTLLPLTHSKTAPLRTPDPAKLKLASFNDAAPGCNLNLCFALDGSRLVTPTEYNLHINFMLDILAALAGNKLELSASQYGNKVTSISALTNSTADFIESLVASSPNGDDQARVNRGVRWCRDSLLARVGEVGKIVVLSSDVGVVEARKAGFVAEKARRNGIETCVVGVGFKNGALLAEIAGESGRVFEVDEFFQFADLAEVLVEMMCGTQLLR